MKPEVNERVSSELYRLYRQGISAKDAVALLSETSGVSKSKLYQAWLKLDRGG